MNFPYTRKDEMQHNFPSVCWIINGRIGWRAPEKWQLYNVSSNSMDAQLKVNVPVYPNFFRK